MVQRRKVLPLVAAALLAAACSQQPPAKPVEAPKAAEAAVPEGSSISGTFVDSAGAPIAGAELTLFEGKPVQDGYVKQLTGKSFVDGKFANPRATSGADGKFTIKVDSKFYTPDAQYVVEALIKNPAGGGKTALVYREASPVVFRIANDRQQIDLGAVKAGK